VEKEVKKVMRLKAWAIKSHEGGGRKKKKKSRKCSRRSLAFLMSEIGGRKIPILLTTDGTYQIMGEKEEGGTTPRDIKVPRGVSGTRGREENRGL